ncbi:enoyl-CoA hydratase/isomerase family protein [Bordetella bronchiseptica]|uniref:enoyl-CoA hydratase/isomerase family protein n=1 Tax=Bordetella bronchiseptica TaxID=518 RepID=UPI0002DDB8C6|nr:enoyl-CoA hydratase/isomerase family protein [Bordetella bronchiseptica]
MSAPACVSEFVRYDVDAGVARITLDRPDRRNAIDVPMRAGPAGRGPGRHGRPGGAAPSVPGRGGRPFLQRRRRLDHARRVHERRAGTRPDGADRRLRAALLEMPKPVIAAVDGIAFGGGFGLCLCADLVLATPAARFCLSFMRIGLVPDFAAAFTLPRLVGLQRARQLIYTAAEIDGRQALEYGLVSELVDAGRLAPRAAEVATAMAGMPATAFALTKQALLRSSSSELAAMVEMEMTSQGVAFNTGYHQQAVERLLEKKPPLYSFPAPTA